MVFPPKSKGELFLEILYTSTEIETKGKLKNSKQFHIENKDFNYLCLQIADAALNNILQNFKSHNGMYTIVLRDFDFICASALCK